MQILQEQKSANVMDGVNADFAGAKICPAADTCQSSHRTPFPHLSKLFHARS
ncbi:hypothetical protein [Methylotuvimicrobium buryatense]|uniref:hypothetical protein n=1 Tax=Methylotuvimicrobium buryatense TaxID=95641 RepID=UPI0003463ACF|nr:hypothetical protein [Methylotuvimicrobium buryatense]